MSIISYQSNCRYYRAWLQQIYIDKHWCYLSVLLCRVFLNEKKRNQNVEDRKYLWTWCVLSCPIWRQTTNGRSRADYGRTKPIQQLPDRPSASTKEFAATASRNEQRPELNEWLWAFEGSQNVTDSIPDFQPEVEFTDKNPARLNDSLSSPDCNQWLVPTDPNKFIHNRS